jgi:hypothetical protein
MDSQDSESDPVFNVTQLDGFQDQELKPQMTQMNHSLPRSVIIPFHLRGSVTPVI